MDWIGWLFWIIVIVVGVIWGSKKEPYTDDDADDPIDFHPPRYSHDDDDESETKGGVTPSEAYDKAFVLGIGALLPNERDALDGLSYFEKRDLAEHEAERFRGHPNPSPGLDDRRIMAEFNYVYDERNNEWETESDYYRCVDEPEEDDRDDDYDDYVSSEEDDDY